MSSLVTAGTQSYLRSPSASAAFTPRAHLFVAMSCASPLDAPSRHVLDGVDEVHIGRGASRAARRIAEAGARRLAITLADHHVSSAHARVVRREGGYVLEDLGSKNGSFVNGTRDQATPLADGDLLQIGQTLLLFRAALPTAPDTPADMEAAARVPSLGTLLPRLARELDALASIATSDVPVLLVSETGTGKEVLARAVHALSKREGDFVPVNCGGLPSTLVESTLFGHKRGAFSGAASDHPGLLRAANGGTLLLDEIGDMPLAVQCAVLRALQEGEVYPVGSTSPVHVDARVIAATHHDLEALVARGGFREDLLARLSGFVFRLPPLRERREDIGLIASALLRRIAAPGRAPSLSPEAGTLLFRHAWPRNVRELEKCLAQATALAAGGRIETSHLPAAVREGIAWTAEPRPASPDEMQARVVALLEKSRGNVTFAAEAMRTSRAQVHRWIKRFAIDLDAFRR
jgi:transcriptional regulator of acetoin/glycerol metabolism